jgi:hypothetical protein
MRLSATTLAAIAICCNTESATAASARSTFGVQTVVVAACTVIRHRPVARQSEVDAARALTAFCPNSPIVPPVVTFMHDAATGFTMLSVVF